MLGEISRNLILFLLVFSINFLQTRSSNFQPIFQQDETVHKTKGKELWKYMNLTVDPCNDFYEFACGKWNKYHILPKASTDFATPQYYLDRKINSDLQNILSEQVTLDDGTAGRKIKEFYSSCLTTIKNGQQQQTFFSEFIKNNGGFPAVPGSSWQTNHYNYNWQKVVASLRNHYGLNILIGLDINLNQRSMHENSIYLGIPDTLIPPNLCSAESLNRTNILNKEYEPIEMEIAQNLKTWLTLNKDEAKKLAAEIITFEYDLCSAIVRDTSKDDDTLLNEQFPRKTLFELTNYFNNTIDFNEFIRESYDTPSYKPVFLTSENYFRRLIKTMAEHNTTTIANYIMYHALSKITLPIDDNAAKRPYYCVNILKKYFPKVLGQMYYRKYASTTIKNEIENIFDKLKISFNNSLQSNWIEWSTSVVGMKKLSEIILAFPSYEKSNSNNLQIISNNYWTNLAYAMSRVKEEQINRIYTINTPITNDEIEAYEARLKYRPLQKRIDIGWGLLQSPYYQQHYPNSMRYALIGQKLAHELATAFDDLSWTSEFLGISNWDRNTAKEYKNRTECFRIQISNYLFNDPYLFWNSTKLRELIATSGGLKVSFYSYLNWLHFLSPNNDLNLLTKETLSELNFSNTQLFFIAYAQMHCRNVIQEDPGHHIFSPLISHTIEKYEVNGPLQNFIEFARDFGCQPGTNMNPVDKCVIF